jgi:hypothetical protein
MQRENREKPRTKKPAISRFQIFYLIEGVSFPNILRRLLLMMYFLRTTVFFLESGSMVEEDPRLLAWY